MRVHGDVLILSFEYLCFSSSRVKRKTTNGRLAHGAIYFTCFMPHAVFHSMEWNNFRFVKRTCNSDDVIGTR